MATCFARITSLPGLLLLVNAAAWAGRGDVDPNYGHGGALKIEAELLIGLPNDRLAIIFGNRVRVADSNGNSVTSYGENGRAVVPTPSNMPRFQAWGAATGLDGRLVVYGDLSNALYTERYEAMFLLDASGQADPAFGGHEDGFLRLTAESYVDPSISVHATLVSFAPDPSGRIVLIERTVDRDNVCVEPARIRRLLPSGANDESFGTGGAAELANLDPCADISIIGVRADDSIVIGSGPAIFSIDAAGGIDMAFGEEGRLSVGIASCCTGFLLQDGGLLLLGSVDGAGGFTDTTLMRFKRNGEPDLSFGAGTGSVTIDLATEFLGEPGSDDFMERMMLSPDGSGYVVQLSASTVESSRKCYGIAKLASDGRPDVSFGDRGLTCLSFGGYRFDLISVQEDGASIFAVRDPRAGIATSAHRLLADATPSPGIITVARSHSVEESAGTTDVVEVARVAGRDGAASINFATVSRPRVFYQCGYHYCQTVSATAGSDYMATSGRLDWASGDDSQRTVSVSILDDDINETREIFGVDFSEPGGGVQFIAAGPSISIADDDDTATIPPPTTSGGGGPPTTSGGGGSVSWATLLALLSLLLMRRWRTRCTT